MFWNAIDNQFRSCERFIGQMSRCLTERKVKDFSKPEKYDKSTLKLEAIFVMGTNQQLNMNFVLLLQGKFS